MRYHLNRYYVIIVLNARGGKGDRHCPPVILPVLFISCPDKGNFPEPKFHHIANRECFRVTLSKVLSSTPFF
jgi:hypothetical protein